jgi:REP element-mobilizing transposase RayT
LRRAKKEPSPRRYAATRSGFPFEIHAVVVLPDHIHAVLGLPEGDADFSTRWHLIKTRFAKALPKQERRSTVRKARGERGIWHARGRLRQGLGGGALDLFYPDNIDILILPG